MEKEIKKTQKDLFGELRELATTYGTQEQVDFIDKKVEQLTRKATNRGPSEKQKANEAFKEIILEVLSTSGKSMRINEIQEQNEILAELSNQKISALLRQLKDTNEVIRTVDKKQAYFSINSD